MEVWISVPGTPVHSADTSNVLQRSRSAGSTVLHVNVEQRIRSRLERVCVWVGGLRHMLAYKYFSCGIGKELVFAPLLLM